MHFHKGRRQNMLLPNHYILRIITLNTVYKGLNELILRKRLKLAETFRYTDAISTTEYLIFCIKKNVYGHLRYTSYIIQLI